MSGLRRVAEALAQYGQLELASEVAQVSLGIKQARKDPKEWLSWFEKTMSDRGRDLHEFAGHFSREAVRDGFLTPEGAKQAKKIADLAKELDEAIGMIIAEFKV